MSEEKTPHINRRQLVEKSSLLAGVAAAASLAGCDPSSAPAAGVFAGGSDIIKLAVVGCGGRAFRSLHSRSTLSWPSMMRHSARRSMRR